MTLVFVTAARIAAAVAARIATAVAAALAATVTAALAGRFRFAAFGRLLTALGLALWLTARILAVVMTEESAKASAATAMAGLRLRLQTHENDGKCRQTQGHAQ
jgi:hypothetical protein